jgi:hypothetical protein
MIRIAGDRLDWNRLVHQAIARSLMLPVIDALDYLRNDLGVNVPAFVISQLREVAPPALAAAEHRVRMQPRSAMRQARYHWIRHRRLSGGSLVGDLARYPDYLRRVWGLRSHSDLARHIIGRLARR